MMTMSDIPNFNNASLEVYIQMDLSGSFGWTQLANDFSIIIILTNVGWWFMGM